jgi:hypothetical protein
MNTVRILRTAAAAGAVSLAVLGFMPTASAHSAAAQKKSSGTSGSGPSLSYTGTAEATGVHFSIDESPQAFPVADLFDVQIPQDNSQLTSAGISTGSAALATPGNSVEGLKLLCSLNDQLGQFCQQLNTVTQNTTVGPYPPDSPLVATAAYPNDNGKTQTAAVGGKELGQKSAVTFFPGQAEARATATEVTTTANGQSSALAAKTQIAITSGSVSADTHQVVKHNVLTITADSAVHDVNIGGIVHINAVSSAVKIVNDGKGHITHSGSTTVSGVTALNQPATITSKGIEIVGKNNKNLLGGTVNSALNKALKTQGFSIKLVGIKTTETKKRATVSSGGVLVNYKHAVNGLPDPSAYLPLCIPDKSNCEFSPPDPNAKYIGIAALGEASVTSFASPIPAIPSVKIPTTATSPGSTSTTNGGSSSLGGAGGTQSPTVAGSSGNGSSGRQPDVAGANSTVNAGDLLSGTAHRLTYLFPAFLLAALAGFGSGVLRHPARIPRSGHE